MLKRISILIFVIGILNNDCFGQATDPAPGYQLMMSNPALSGSEGDGIMRLSYLNYFPGNNFNLHSVFFSYDSYFPVLHGGAGFYISDDYLGGIVNDLRGGLSYAYFLQAGRKLFINAGLSGSVYHRGYNFDKAVLPDQIDPLGGISVPSSESVTNSGRTVFDIGAGFLFISGNIFGGFSINHLAEPDISLTGSSSERLKRKFLLHLSGDFNLNRTKRLKILPQAYLRLQGGLISAGAGAVLAINSLSANVIIINENKENLNLQTGFCFKSGKVSFYYNYRFNIVSGNNLLPFSLLHQTGITFSLNNVEKRNQIKTINLPEL
jgi:type IX secretion system PorP/SprF family membrane protein